MASMHAEVAVAVAVAGTAAAAAATTTARFNFRGAWSFDARRESRRGGGRVGGAAEAGCEEAHPPFPGSAGLSKPRLGAGLTSRARQDGSEIRPATACAAVHIK
eukprot:353234-Chlamydomonas_euryale.AAC.5